jgi:hypothetical protein
MSLISAANRVWLRTDGFSRYKTAETRAQTAGCRPPGADRPIKTCQAHRNSLLCVDDVWMMMNQEERSSTRTSDELSFDWELHLYHLLCSLTLSDLFQYLSSNSPVLNPQKHGYYLHRSFGEDSTRRTVGSTLGLINADHCPSVPRTVCFHRLGSLAMPSHRKPTRSPSPALRERRPTLRSRFTISTSS